MFIREGQRITDTHGPDPRRIVVIGTTGSGKTTLAARLGYSHLVRERVFLIERQDAECIYSGPSLSHAFAQLPIEEYLS